MNVTEYRNYIEGFNDIIKNLKDVEESKIELKSEKNIKSDLY